MTIADNLATHKTWGTLKKEAPLYHLFPDGKVPIRSIFPIVPKEGAPPCLLIPGNLLTDEQILEMAKGLYEKWKPECESVEMAIDYIKRDAMPIRVEFIEGTFSSDPGFFFTLMSDVKDDEDEDFDEELDDLDDDDEFDDEGYEYWGSR